jgi:type III pantothenate kinase
MLLAVDCGNTNTVFAIWDGNHFLGTWRVATDWRRTADEYFVWLRSIMRLAEVEATVTEVIISSTVPRVVFNLRVLADRYFGARPLVVGSPTAACLARPSGRGDAGGPRPAGERRRAPGTGTAAT